MFYMLFFAAGYWIGSGGKIAFQPGVSQGADGSLVVGPPQTRPGIAPSTVGYSTNTGRYEMPSSLGYPPGTTYDATGNIFDGRGALIGTGAGGLPGLAMQGVTYR